MGAPLIERWTAGGDWLEVLDRASVSQARELVRRLGTEAGLAEVTLEALATATSELAQNQLDHARAGRLAVRPVTRAGVPGVEVIAADAGPGLADPAGALAGRGPATGLGAGLAGARRLAQELDLDVRAGEGTCARARAFARPVPRSEVAVFGRPFPGERVSGDDAAFVRTDDALLVAVVDGLGHGPEARAASTVVTDALVAAPDAALPELVERARAAAAGTRGAVLALVRLHLATRAVEHVGLGDVRVLLGGPGGAQVIPSQPGLLSGRPNERARARQSAAALSPHGALLVLSDGLKSAAGPPAAPVAEPIAVAQDLVARFGRETDDALALVVRTG
ncbi:MAG: SpoIIE family protein phosphatase [Planctomycetes bacterium]|nr:SpoIIE family protein phosphatase [Planctomycetota bacterium]